MLLDVGGQDATEPFEDVGHSDEAREILDGLLVGDLKRVVRPYLLFCIVNFLLVGMAWKKKRGMLIKEGLRVNRISSVGFLYENED